MDAFISIEGDVLLLITDSPSIASNAF